MRGCRLNDNALNVGPDTGESLNDGLDIKWPGKNDFGGCLCSSFGEHFIVRSGVF